MRVTVSIFVALLSASSAFAGTKNVKVGESETGHIFRTVDVATGLVCFTARGIESISTSCVKRAVKSAPAVALVGAIETGDLNVVTDDVLKISCSVARGIQAISISCQ